MLQITEYYFHGEITGSHGKRCGSTQSGIAALGNTGINLRKKNGIMDESGQDERQARNILPDFGTLIVSISLFVEEFS
jgi:hypothetical protein